MLEDIFLSNGYPEVSAYELYSDLYHFGEDYVERVGEYATGHYDSDGKYIDGKYNPIGQVFEEITVKDPNDKTKTKKVRRVKLSRIILQDNLEEALLPLQQFDSSVLYPCGFNGGRLTRRRKGQKIDEDQEVINPQIMHGMIIEIDDVTEVNLKNLFSHINVNKMYPMPNYIACSGGGLHLYYVLSKPLRLDTNELKNQMNFLKEILTLNLWNPYTSQNKNPQIQTIKQGYRVIGSLTKASHRKERPIVRAFHTHKEHYSIDDLKEWASSNFDFMYRDRQDRLNRKTREECQKLYPEWYQKRIIEQRPPGYYTNKTSAFYDYWIKIIKKQANYGHRYKAVKTLAIVALKSKVPFERLYSDVHELVPFLSALNTSEPFTHDEADQAIQAYYDKRNYRTKYETLIELANVKVDYQPYKRKGLTREDGLEIARTTLRLKRKSGTFKENGGRKDNETREVLSYLADNDYLSIKTEKEFDKRIRGKITGIAKEIGVSRPTVYKAIKIVKWFNKWRDDEAISEEEITNSLESMREMISYLQDEGVIDSTPGSFKRLEFSSLNDEQKRKFTELCIKHKLDIYHLWPKQFLES